MTSVCDYTGKKGRLHVCSRNEEHRYCISNEFYKEVLGDFQTNPRSYKFTVEGSVKNFVCKKNPWGPKAPSLPYNEGDDEAWCLMCLNHSKVGKYRNLHQYKSIEMGETIKKDSPIKKNKKKKKTYTQKQKECYKFICCDGRCRYSHNLEQEKRKQAMRTLLDMKRTIYHAKEFDKQALLAKRKVLSCLETLDIPETTTFARKDYFAPNIIAFFFARVQDAHSHAYLKDYIDRCITTVKRYSQDYYHLKEHVVVEKEPPPQEDMPHHMLPPPDINLDNFPALAPTSTTTDLNLQNFPDKKNIPPPGFEGHDTLPMDIFASTINDMAKTDVTKRENKRENEELKRENEELKRENEELKREISKLKTCLQTLLNTN